MKYLKISLYISVACGLIVSIAANYETKDQRNHKKMPSYQHVLSEAFATILDYERQNGSFENIDYFEAQSQQALGRYNTRPLNVNSLMNQKSKYRELRTARFELMRFMNGFAKKIAPKNVAMMHAAFDCRVKNYLVNDILNHQCKNIFQEHKAKANNAVQKALGTKIVQNETNRLITGTVKKENVTPKIVSMMPIIQKGDTKYNKSRKKSAHGVNFQKEIFSEPEEPQFANYKVIASEKIREINPFLAPNIVKEKFGKAPQNVRYPFKVANKENKAFKVSLAGIGAINNKISPEAGYQSYRDIVFPKEKPSYLKETVSNISQLHRIVEKSLHKNVNHSIGSVPNQFQFSQSKTLDTQKKYEKIIFSTIKSYMQLYQYQQHVIAFEENLAALLAIEKLVKARSKSDNRYKIEKKNLDTHISLAKKNLKNAKIKHVNAQKSLELMIGEKVNFVVALPRIITDKKFASLEGYFKNREGNLEASLERYYPKFDIISDNIFQEDYGNYARNIRDNAVKFEFSVPIFGEEPRHIFRNQRHTSLSAMKAKKLKLQNKLNQDLKKAYQKRLGALEKMKIAQHEIKSHTFLESMNKQQFKLGDKNILISNLVAARARMMRAKVNKLRAQVVSITSYYKIQHLLKGIVPQFCTRRCKVIDT